jgi:aconitate hydratase
MELPMNEPFNPQDFLRILPLAGKRTSRYYSLSALAEAGIGRIERLPVCLRILLESLLRNCDGRRVEFAHVRALASWQPQAPRNEEIPFMVARVILQDYTGVPLLADLAALRACVERHGRDPRSIEPRVPVSLIVDHSVQTEHTRGPDSLRRNMQREFERNGERYGFMKWGASAFKTVQVIPPGVGIVHQVNLEHLARGLIYKDAVCHFDSVIGTDSHTTMINGIGVVGWGVGGIEAEAAMLGEPVHLLTPDVVGVHLRGRLREGVTTTDLVLTLTELLRHTKVVGKLVEFFGDGARDLEAMDRATLANMAPDYGATMGFFAIDEATLDYLASTGRSAEEVAATRAYCIAQKVFGTPMPGQIDYSTVVELDLDGVEPSVAGPRRPQDRLTLPDLPVRFAEQLAQSTADGGYGQAGEESGRRVKLGDASLGHGDVLIAGITSCTNTSNPGVLLAAGLLAQKAVARGLGVSPRVKTSFAPGSRAATAYLQRAGLMASLEALGFGVTAYGCATCIGNVGNLDPKIESAVIDHDLIATAVLSGNRNFEARIHPSIRANFLASPPLVVAFALAGTVRIDLTREPLGIGADGRPVYLRELWPSRAEVAALAHYARSPDVYLASYANLQGEGTPWQQIPAADDPIYAWDERSTYVAHPPFLNNFARDGITEVGLTGARALLVLGDSITTDHISPAGRIHPSSDAGAYLQARGVAPQEFNTFGARRGHHEVMMRGTFANPRLNNALAAGRTGGFTRHQPSGEILSVFAAAERYQAAGVPTLVFAGLEYGTGSSRDWAAKGTQLLGVRAVVARSFERIHRSNLVGMGVLPCQFLPGESAAALQLRGDESFELTAPVGPLQARQRAQLVVVRADGTRLATEVILRLDTPVEVEVYQSGGILPHVMRQHLAA